MSDFEEIHQDNTVFHRRRYRNAMNEEKMNEEDILRAIEQTKLFIRVKTFYLVIFLIFALATPLFEKVYNATSDQIRRYNLLVIIAVVICLPVYARRIMEANNDIKNYRKMLTENEEIDGEQKPEE